MIRFWSKEIAETQNKGWENGIQKEYVILDENVWKKGREYFAKHKSYDGSIILLPVLNKRHELICFAWQDAEANRELRMLHELEECEDALGFHDWTSDYTGVMIHGCNELAYYFAEYLQKQGIKVQVEGEFWHNFAIGETQEVLDGLNYEIWAEGVHRKGKDIYEERFRSVSAEFECVNEIYEANIKAGKIKDADGDADELIRKLKSRKEIVIRGVGTKAQEAYDWLLSNGLDIVAFLSEKARGEGRESLFGKPILRKTEAVEQFSDAVILECGAKYSAWGFGSVDLNDYEGYERNKGYFLLRDYLEVPENGLMNIFRGVPEGKIFLVGDIRLCSRFYRWWMKYGIKAKNIGYLNVLNENLKKAGELHISEADISEVDEGSICLLIVPEYDSVYHITQEAANNRKKYIEKLYSYGIYDYTDYYSDIFSGIHLEMQELKYIRKELRPGKILLGAIPPHSGNTLIRHSLSGHPQILIIQEFNYFNNNLYSICVRLAEENAADILTAFWHLYRWEAGEEAISKYFPDKEKFDRKLGELLELGDYFTSQELFVMFHLAYEAMYGREISCLEDLVIYWEPHQWDRALVGEWAYWLGCEDVEGFLLRTVRNLYMRTGSGIRTDFYAGKRWGALWGCMGINDWRKKKRNLYANWEERTVRFEDLKREPEKELSGLCRWLGISFNDTLLQTTCHGKKAFYRNIVGDTTGFGLEPIYKQYEEYFSSFDRMRLCLIDGPFQKEYGYPYVSCLDFTRRELQEMFLKEFRWEKLQEMEKGEDKIGIWQMQERFRFLLWQIRFIECNHI